MIKKLSIADNDSFCKLGLLLKDNFSSLYNLQEIISLDYEDVWGFYNDDELVGFIHLSVSFENIDIVNIVVDPLHRNLGIAISLIESIEKNYPDCEHLFLEVREDNIPAINLYKKMSFLEINRRKNYYNNADALVMERNIKK